MEYVDAITRGEPPQEPSRILQASLASQNKAKPDLSQPVEEENISIDDLNAPIG